ncbi:hypothetical protein DIPPA_16242 [Diplonema papillatum]|nr:hypothetical protein DIPPA_16242 [Diplonema papillatum]
MRGRWLLAVLAATSADAACTAIAVQSDPVDVSLRKYGDNVDECWDVSCTSPNAVGSLSFSVFGTQQGSDFVIVDATSYSGSTLPPDTPFAAGVTLNVRFTSNGDTITDTGFAAAATCTIPSTPAPVETCTNVVVDSTDPVSVEQLGYANDLDICWLLDFQCAGEAVAELIFTAFDTEPTFDIVKVGSTDYSGTTLPPATTFEASLRVGFISDEGVTKAGFSAQASCIVPSTPAPAVCSSVVVSSTATQTIERLNYGDGDDVCWQVSCSSSLADGSAVFTAMDTEESTDIVKVNGVSYSGTALPGGGGSVHTWRDGTFEVSFTSDENGVTGVGSPTGFSITVECALDECEVSGTTCTDAGQVCDDATRNVMNDWTCTCEAPTVGQATAAVAACTFDECDPSGCGSGQVCDDPDKDAAVRNNWKCTCIYPTEGEATGAPADCTLDECESEGCGYLQYCNDPTDGTTETGDWTCTCVTPSEGSVATGEDATCTLDDFYKRLDVRVHIAHRWRHRYRW